MLLSELEYARPESVEEAIRLLAREDARALAGGQSLVNVMKTRIATPALVVDLGRVKALAGIRRVDGGLEIGAMTTYATIVESADVAAERPILAEVARTITKVETAIVRPVHIVGPNVRNAPSTYLRLKYPWTVAGFDPMVQLIHEEDVALESEATTTATTAMPEWFLLIARGRLAPDSRHYYDADRDQIVNAERPVSHVRIRIYPDGGISRVRVYGEPID